MLHAAEEEGSSSSLLTAGESDELGDTRSETDCVGWSVCRSVSRTDDETGEDEAHPDQAEQKKKGQRLAEKNGSFGREDERREEERLDRKEGRGEMGDGKEEKSETVENRECGPGT